MSTIYYKTLLTGGTGAALDSLDEDDLSDGDLAIIVQDLGAANITRLYSLDEDSGLSEDSPDVITPDGAVGNKRWILQTSFGRDILGFVQRAEFAWVDADEITIGPGTYHLSGTEERIVYWDTDITFQFGSGGSNSDSSDLANDDWFYLYLDDSAIETGGTNELTASEFVNSTTEPTWSDAKRGWYNGSDRCIFAAKTETGAANLLEFLNQNSFVIYADGIEDRAIADLDDTWTDVVLTLPKFCQNSEVYFRSNYVDTSVQGRWRTNGQTGTNGHLITYVGVGVTQSVNTVRVITDSSQTIEVKHSAAGGDRMEVHTSGWYFPKGM